MKEALYVHSWYVDSLGGLITFVWFNPQKLFFNIPDNSPLEKDTSYIRVLFTEGYIECV